MKNTTHKFSIRVYYEDTDAGKIVYYANYLKFAERARTEYLRDLGIIQTNIAEEHSVYFVVKKAEVNFKSPAKLDDFLEVNTIITKISKASIVMSQSIMLNENILCEVEVKIACVDLNIKPKAIPKKIFDILNLK